MRNCLDSLTQREQEILALLIQGADNATVANRLGISYATVRTHVRSILAKLDVHTRLEAVAKAIQWGFRGHPRWAPDLCVEQSERPNGPCTWPHRHVVAPQQAKTTPGTHSLPRRFMMPQHTQDRQIELPRPYRLLWTVGWSFD